jgi:hypothetical protein
MRLTAPVMPALTERYAVANDDGPDGRVRRGIGDRARREFTRACEIHRVGVQATETPFQNAM